MNLDTRFFMFKENKFTLGSLKSFDSKFYVLPDEIFNDEELRVYEASPLNKILTKMNKNFRIL